MLKNIAVIAILSAAVFWLGHESSERGVFKYERVEQNASNEAQLPIKQPDPAPTPLPNDFPQVVDGDLESAQSGFLSLQDAYSNCWKKNADRVPEIPPDGEITTLEAESLFGKIKKREILEKSNGALKVGLLFDNVIFPAGAAGSATEKDGRINQFRLRAAGRMLHCESPNRCECL